MQNTTCLACYTYTDEVNTAIIVVSVKSFVQKMLSKSVSRCLCGISIVVVLCFLYLYTLPILLIQEKGRGVQVLVTRANGRFEAEDKVEESSLPAAILNTSASSPSGYVLVQRYKDQHGTGMAALVSLHCWITTLNLPMMIVEPFLYETFLQAPSYSSMEPGTKLSDVIDLSSYNESPCSTGIVTWEEYLASARPSAVMVKMIPATDTTQPLPPPRVLWNAEPGSTVCHSLIDMADYTDYCFVRVVEAYYTPLHIFHSQDFHNVILNNIDPGGVTFVFSEWQEAWTPSPPPLTFPPVAPPLLTPPSLTSPTLTSLTVTPPLPLCCISHQLWYQVQESPKLIHDVQHYQKWFLMTSETPSYIAVLLPEENILWSMSNSSTVYLQECLNQVLTEVEQSKLEMSTENVFVAADLDDYVGGSTKKKMIRRTVENIYGGHRIFNQWRRSFVIATAGVEERGYIAAMQRALFSQASCVVLMGGGNSQVLALTSYLERISPETKCVRFVCIDPVRMNLFRVLMESY